MRQLVNFLNKIHVRNTKKEYYRSSLLAKLSHAEIAPLEEVLGVPLEEETPFDEQADRVLEKRALEILEKQKATYSGQRTPNKN